MNEKHVDALVSDLCMTVLTRIVGRLATQELPAGACHVQLDSRRRVAVFHRRADERTVTGGV
jgi:hypothetical protein